MFHLTLLYMPSMKLSITTAIAAPMTNAMYARVSLNRTCDHW